MQKRAPYKYYDPNVPRIFQKDEHSHYTRAQQREFYKDNLVWANQHSEQKQIEKDKELAMDKFNLQRINQEINDINNIEKLKKISLKNKQYDEYINYLKTNGERNPYKKDDRLSNKIGTEERYIKLKDYYNENENITLNPMYEPNNKKNYNVPLKPRELQKGERPFNIINNEVYDINKLNEKKKFYEIEKEDDYTISDLINPEIKNSQNVYIKTPQNNNLYNNPELKNYNEYLQNLQKINLQNLKENNSSINNKKKEEIEYKPNNYNVNYLNNINNNNFNQNEKNPYEKYLTQRNYIYEKYAQNHISSEFSPAPQFIPEDSNLGKIDYNNPEHLKQLEMHNDIKNLYLKNKDKFNPLKSNIILDNQNINNLNEINNNYNNNNNIQNNIVISDNKKIRQIQYKNMLDEQLKIKNLKIDPLQDFNLNKNNYFVNNNFDDYKEKKNKNNLLLDLPNDPFSKNYDYHNKSNIKNNPII